MNSADIFKLLVAISLNIGILTQGSSIFETNFRALHHEPLTSASLNTSNVKTKWIEQKLDHFDENENSTWKMRYMENDEYFQNGGPIFIFVGGEWEILPGILRGGHMHDMAKEHKGYLYYTEHRYYGKSYPTEDLSTENLKYLDVKQALADLAHFIRFQKETVAGLAESAVILTGGSYSATMVTWFKRLYPDLVTGCWASSAPLLAKPDFYEYKEVTGESITLVGGEQCSDSIRNGIAQLEEMIANGSEKQVEELLNICDSFNATKNLDVWTLFNQISNIFAGLVKNHVDGNIQRACKTILSEDDDLVGLVKFIRPRFNQKPCSKVTFKALMEYLNNIKLNTGMMRRWLYQTCNELGWYQTSTSDKQPFGKNFPLEYYVKTCAETYDNLFSLDIINGRTNETNEIFGGLNPGVSNVYMTHGQLDPWRAIGIQDPELAKIIPFHAHCKDLWSISEKDAPELRDSKEKIAQLVREWVQSK